MVDRRIRETFSVGWVIEASRIDNFRGKWVGRGVFTRGDKKSSTPVSGKYR